MGETIGRIRQHTTNTPQTRTGLFLGSLVEGSRRNMEKPPFEGEGGASVEETLGRLVAGRLGMI
jgi:hypothetical protein